ncbi:hypothetical protein GCM10010168_75370 [Actinoplanes ianthinogenes]|uniref:IPT/TIG domain-containing protein n=1 Tax=Actinoplanes ianthinogenes TaxID=122358 RepID=A0ABN6C8V9_9ACTN|nr:IPT/TIG domain-containing protein [Actinoplanes ianthinogenes]BCJ41849.1 hypothetical protein Aiant_25060 [Actinoplanes ianthinogenes]GGR45532.1 hypothetical protein GCM10010168_75370 [Actinoplanes ianthinogenes]
MNKSKKAARQKWLYGAVALGTAAAGVAVATADLPAYAAPVALVLSSTNGPSAGGNALTGTATPTTANPSPFPDGSTLAVQFQFYGTSNTSCYGAAASQSAVPRATAAVTASGAVTTAGVQNATGVKRVSTTKIAFTVPTGLALVGSQATSKWNVCVYDTGTNSLLATTTYTINARPKITSITPTSSPSLGGQTITVNGEGFATAAGATTATIGGAALTNIKMNSSGTSFTAVTPQHAADTGLAVVVSTTGGTVTSLDPDNNNLPQDADNATNDAPIPFSYSNGISVTPNTSPNTAQVDVDVRGVGFQDFILPGALDDNDSEVARVLLLDAPYAQGSTSTATAECTGVLIIDDTELICTLDLNGADGATDADPADNIDEGTYTLTVVENASDQEADMAVANPSIISSGSTFTVAPY